MRSPLYSTEIRDLCQDMNPSMELPRFSGSSELCVMRGIGSATQGHEHTPFQIECSMRLALEAVSPCDAEFCRQNGFTQSSEEPV